MIVTIRPCGHTDWVDMLKAPCLECRLQKVLEAGAAKIRAAAGLEPDTHPSPRAKR